MKQTNITNKQQIQQLTYEELSDETESLRKFFSEIEKFFNTKIQYHYHEYFGGIIETTEEEHKTVVENAFKDNQEIALVKWLTEENPLFFDFLWIKQGKRFGKLQDYPSSTVIRHLLEYLCMFPWKIGFLGSEIKRFGKDTGENAFFKENQHLFIVDKLTKSYDPNSNDNLICPICMEYVYLQSDMLMATCCGKIFHDACLHQWTYDYSDKCPNCRAPEVQGYQSFIFTKTDYEH